MISLIASNQRKESLVHSHDPVNTHKLPDVKATLLVVPLPCKLSTLSHYSENSRLLMTVPVLHTWQYQLQRSARSSFIRTMDLH